MFGELTVSKYLKCRVTASKNILHNNMLCNVNAEVVTSFIHDEA